LRIYAIAILSLFLISPFIFSQTDIGGTIDDIQNWVPQKSPYVINDELIINENGNVTVNPGTEIKFGKNGKITVKGKFNVKGTEERPVRFISLDKESFYEGISFESKYKNDIEYAIMIRGAIKTEGTALSMSNCYILDSTGIEILAFSNVTLNNNYFYENTYGLYIEGKNILCSATGNTFNKSRFGLYLKSPFKGKLAGNNFFSSETANAINFTPYDIDCKKNYWGNDIEKEILKSMVDKTKDNKLGQIMFKPYDKKQLTLFMPPEAFSSLVKIYLKLQKKEEDIRYIGIGGGICGFFPVAPQFLQQQSSYGLGSDFEFSVTIAGPFTGSLEAKIIGLQNQNTSTYIYQYSATNMYFDLYGYLGYRKDAYFMPFIKICNGLSMITEQYKFITGETEKFSNTHYIAAAGPGIEYFLQRFISIKIDACYNYSPASGGGLSSITADARVNLYFSTPFFLNE